MTLIRICNMVTPIISLYFYELFYLHSFIFILHKYKTMLC